MFLINGNYYIKFVAYSPKNHLKLNSKNFVVEGDVVSKERYLPTENVILYIPYRGDIIKYNLIKQEDFEFDSEFKSILNYLLMFFPGLIFFLVWFIFGREHTYDQIPKELSAFPSDRVFWEVAAYFNPPFLRIDKNFFAATLLNFYNKKIIDIKEKEKEIYIKLNVFKGDSLEKQIYELLKEAESLLKDNIKKGFFGGGLTSKQKEKCFDGEYFNLKIAMQNQSLASEFLEIRKDIKEKGKKYLHNNHGITILCLFLSVFFVYLIDFTLNFDTDIELNLDLWYVFAVIISLLTIPLTKGTLFTKFKGEYYIEYQKWKAFKRYLKNSFSIKTATHKTTVIWNDYLVYATALGVPKKVIEELKTNNIIDEKHINIYNGVILASSTSFSSASGGAGGGGFGGAGGGGVGGGGGGGR